MKIDQLSLKKIIKELWPLNRSITGQAVRETHKILSKIVKFEKKEIKTGKIFFDWTVPREWNVKDAYIQDPKGNKIVSFKENNLHLVGYSVPTNQSISLDRLQKHLFSNPKNVNSIPYVTSYYKKNWGFCISHKQRLNLKKGKYKVFIDSSLKKGNLTISDIVIKGKSNKEILFQSYTCHPSMAVNELIGPIIITYLAKFVKKIKKPKYTYRFVLLPETIGSVIYINKNFKNFKKNLRAGYIITCFGRNYKYVYKNSRARNAIANKYIYNFFGKKMNFKKIDYNPGGSDERQYNSIGNSFPVGCIMSEIPGKYKGYHSSEDNYKKLKINVIKKNINDFTKFIKFIEKEKFYSVKVKNCEPHISKYVNFYGTKSNLNTNPNLYTKCLKWLVHYLDGETSISEISKISKISKQTLLKVSKILYKKKLLHLY